MKVKKYSAENLLTEILKLDTVQFLGVCRILSIELVEDLKIGPLKDVEVDEESGQSQGTVDATFQPREFGDIWCDLCDKLESMNRTQRRNLGRLVYAATKKGDDDE